MNHYLKKFNLKNYVKSKYDYPIYVDNDANCAAWWDLVKYEEHKEENAIVTDDTSVVEKYGHKVYLYEGDYTNIKITTPEDLILAERLI